MTEPTVAGVKSKSLTGEFDLVSESYITAVIEEVSGKLASRVQEDLWVTAVELAVAHLLRNQILGEGGGGGQNPKPPPPGPLQSVTVGPVSKTFGQAKQPDLPGQYAWLYTPYRTPYGDRAADIIRRWPPAFAGGAGEEW